MLSKMKREREREREVGHQTIAIYDKNCPSLNVYSMIIVAMTASVCDRGEGRERDVRERRTIGMMERKKKKLETRIKVID